MGHGTPRLGFRPPSMGRTAYRRHGNELKELGQYATQVFAAHPKLPEQTGRMPQLEPAKLARHIASQTRESCSSLEALRAASVTGPRPILRFLGNSAASGRWSDQSGLVSYPEAGKADKPSQLRPLGILRPDAKGLAGTAKDRCLSSLTSQDVASPTPKVGSCRRFGNSVAR